MGHIRGPADARPREAIRVAVADTRHLIAEALGALVATMDGLELVEVFDGTDALPTIVSRHPDVLLVGIGGDSTGAFELVRSLRRIVLNLEIVLVQLEVLTLVAEGCSYDEIGARLFISANTVKFHLRSVYVRLGVRNRMAAARMLTERGGTEATRSPRAVN